MHAKFNADEVTPRDLVLGLNALATCRALGLALLPARMARLAKREAAAEAAGLPKVAELHRNATVPNDDAADDFVRGIIGQLQTVKGAKGIRRTLCAELPERNRTVAGASQAEVAFVRNPPSGSNRTTNLDYLKRLVDDATSMCSSLDLVGNYRPESPEAKHLKATRASLALLERLISPFECRAAA